jgi:hypothetical protein
MDVFSGFYGAVGKEKKLREEQARERKERMKGELELTEQSWTMINKLNVKLSVMEGLTPEDCWEAVDNLRDEVLMTRMECCSKLILSLSKIQCWEPGWNAAVN